MKVELDKGKIFKMQGWMRLRPAQNDDVKNIAELLDWKLQPATKEKVSDENSMKKTALKTLEVLSIGLTLEKINVKPEDYHAIA